MSQRVLILGANGFIGRHTVRHLTENGFAVIGHHRLQSKPPRMSGVTWIGGDLTDVDETNNWPAQCDTVLYLAQSPHWRKFPKHAEHVAEVNTFAVLRAMSYARKVKAKRFVLVSSGSVYGPHSGPVRENRPLAWDPPSSFYSATKQAAEVLLKPYGDFLRVIILRLFVPYGPGQDSKMLLPQLVRRVKQGQPIDLQGQNGLQINPIAIWDVCQVIRRCLGLDKSITLNVAGPHILTLRDVGHRIGRVLGRSAKFVVKGGQKAPMVVGDTTLLKRTLAWEPEIDLREGLQRWLGDQMEPGP